MTKPAIAVLPYGHALGPGLAKTPVSDLVWPLGCPSRLQGANVGALEPDDHLIIFPKTASHFRWVKGTKAKISLILGEPSVIGAKHLALLRLSHHRFWRVLSFNETLLSRIPNGIFFPLGTTWVPEWRDLSLEKSKMCSLIASHKRDSKGHKLRHEIADWVQDTPIDVDVMGRGYQPFKDKSEGLASYRYSVVIENVQEKNYFSEKIIDAVLCDTVPIYWGCPNLDRFFDPSGIIQCDSAADIRAALENMSVDDHANRLGRLTKLKPELEHFCNLERRAVQAIHDNL